MTPLKRMPGPNLLRSFGYMYQFRKNYLKPMETLFAEYGDYVGFGNGLTNLLMFHPNAVEHVLKTNAKNYTKPPNYTALQPMLGMGLLTADGEPWREHRRLIAPEFQHKKIEIFFSVMQAHLEQTLHEWAKHDQPFDIAPAISRVTYRIAGECFFGAKVDSSSDIVYNAIDIASDVAVKRMSTPFNLPIEFPLPSHRRMFKAVREMNEIVYGIIDERLRVGGEANDVLTRLTKINNESGTMRFTRQQIRDEVMTLLLAGHETTGNALSWTLLLLGQHPDIQARVRDEIRTKVSGFTPTMAELKNLSYTESVFKESMRLYPPAAMVGRQAIEADSVEGYEIPKGAVVNLAQWITHRHPVYWSEPEKFKPERFEAGEPSHPYAYYPFGAGARECIGRNMAVIEGMALLAGMIRNFEFELVSRDVQVRPLITLRPDPGVIMKVKPVHWN